MILVDTSVWIEHFRHGNDELEGLLKAERVLIHPYVIGELVLGNFRNQVAVISAIMKLPQAPVIFHGELLHFVNREALSGSGIGYVDAHLLAAARIRQGAALWTRDKSLHAAAEKLGLAASQRDLGLY